jgi:uncharacterized membrane protein YgcG
MIKALAWIICVGSLAGHLALVITSPSGWSWLSTSGSGSRSWSSSSSGGGFGGGFSGGHK